MLKKFPRTHLFAACGFAAVAAVGLMLSPSSEVEAQRISVSLNLESGKLEPIDASLLEYRTSPEEQLPPADFNPAEVATESEPENQSDPLQSETAPSEVEVTVKVEPALPDTAATAATTEPAPAATPSAPAATKTVIDVPPELDWQEFTARSGDTLSTLFSKAGFNDALMYKVIQGEGKQLARLYKGNQLRFGSDDGTLQEIVLVRSRTEKLRSQLVEDRYITKQETVEPQIELAFATGEIENSLFIAGQKAGLNPKITMELAGIFGWDIDFVYDIRKGDKFEVLYEKQHLDGEEIGDGRILAANFTNRGRKITAILYTNEQGRTAYYSPDGKSVQKAFLRAPIDARISSSFNLQRRHPILNVVRPHEGTDYAAATGSPIMAAGDGRVRFMGNKGGYGRTIILQHGDGITTLYAHLNGYARGLASGKTVKQGQTIGYVGSSGMATGPHLHYEFRVNGAPRNSRTVKLPDAVPVPKQEMAKFKAVANKLVARLDSGMKDTQLALAEEE